MSYREATAAYGVPRNTIYSHLHQVVTQSLAGRPRVLSDLEETVMVRCCLALASFGYPATRDVVGAVATFMIAAE